MNILNFLVSRLVAFRLSEVLDRFRCRRLLYLGEGNDQKEEQDFVGGEEEHIAETRYLRHPRGDKVGNWTSDVSSDSVGTCTSKVCIGFPVPSRASL